MALRPNQRPFQSLRSTLKKFREVSRASTKTSVVLPYRSNNKRLVWLRKRLRLSQTEL